MRPTLQSNHIDDFGLLKNECEFRRNIFPPPPPPSSFKPLRMEQTNEEEKKFLACNSQ